MNTLSTAEERKYAQLADRAEHGELTVKPGTVQRGDDAAAAGRAMLVEATGASTIEEATQVALGRPRLGEEGRTETTTWKIRTPASLDQGVRAAAKRRGVTVSEYIRIAAAHQIQADTTT